MNECMNSSNLHLLKWFQNSPIGGEEYYEWRQMWVAVVLLLRSLRCSPTLLGVCYLRGGRAGCCRLHVLPQR